MIKIIYFFSEELSKTFLFIFVKLQKNILDVPNYQLKIAFTWGLSSLNGECDVSWEPSENQIYLIHQVGTKQSYEGARVYYNGMVHCAIKSSARDWWDTFCPFLRPSAAFRTTWCPFERPKATRYKIFVFSSFSIYFLIPNMSLEAENMPNWLFLIVLGLYGLCLYWF